MVLVLEVKRRGHVQIGEVKVENVSHHNIRISIHAPREIPVINVKPEGLSHAKEADEAASRSDRHEGENHRRTRSYR
jgi:sRNA-binding carbon storage regulator CsrA